MDERGGKCPLVIWHGGCDDGHGAAFFINALIGKDTALEFFPGVYGKPPPDVTDRHVIMVDFSYKRAVLEPMIAAARSMLILDHHKTAMEDLSGLVGRNGLPAYSYAQLSEWCGVSGYDPRKGALGVTFDMTRSGAGLAWDFFSDRAPRIPFVDYLEDRDLWRKQLPDGDQFTIALRSYPQDFETWGVLVDRGIPALIAEGRPLQRYYRQRVEEIKKSAYLAQWSGTIPHEIWEVLALSGHAGVTFGIANAPYFAASEVAGELAAMEMCDFGASYFEVEAGRWQYSLRSRGDFDVSAIAKAFGGGGHKGAAGFTVDTQVHVSCASTKPALGENPFKDEMAKVQS